MTAPGCIAPASCPVPDPDPQVLARVSTHLFPAGTELRRGHRTEYAAVTPVAAVHELPLASRMSRFAPILGSAHAYVARREIAALLESVFHELVPTSPRVNWARAEAFSLTHVRLRHAVRLIDLRDPQLERLGIGRSQLVASGPGHYPCTRVWAEALRGRGVGGHTTHGLIWHSRQAELHAAGHGTRLFRDVLVGEQAEVAVIWPDPEGDLLAPAGGPGSLSTGAGAALAEEVAALLGAPGRL